MEVKHYTQTELVNVLVLIISTPVYCGKLGLEIYCGKCLCTGTIYNGLDNVVRLNS
jgi:hypothetical protein